jgi:ubiquinone/menaquinone biosynthesis C-methylase UbiE
MDAVIQGDGWEAHNIWSHSEQVHNLYRKRCRLEEVEMTCHRQAAEILSSFYTPNESVIDIGCGSGYFFHSLKKKNLEVSYYGIDATEAFIQIGQEEMPVHGLSADQLKTMRIEDFSGEADHLICLNVLSNIDNYHRPLERIASAARQSIILRESIKDGSEYKYVRDRYLDKDVSLNVHVNAYDLSEVRSFLEGYGFTVDEIVDEYTQGEPEDVIGYPHYWRFIVARRANC